MNRDFVPIYFLQYTILIFIFILGSSSQTLYLYKETTFLFYFISFICLIQFFFYFLLFLFFFLKKEMPLFGYFQIGVFLGNIIFCHITFEDQIINFLFFFSIVQLSTNLSPFDVGINTRQSTMISGILVNIYYFIYLSLVFIFKCPISFFISVHIFGVYSKKYVDALREPRYFTNQQGWVLLALSICLFGFLQFIYTTKDGSFEWSLTFLIYLLFNSLCCGINLYLFIRFVLVFLFTLSCVFGDFLSFFNFFFLFFWFPFFVLFSRNIEKK